MSPAAPAPGGQKPAPELFELVTWGDVAAGDHVWSMGGVCLITGPPFANPGETFRPGIARFPHRSDDSGSEFAPPMELHHRVPRRLRPARGPAGDDARSALAAALSGLQAVMLARDQDITDNETWKPAEREFLLALITLAHRQLAS